VSASDAELAHAVAELLAADDGPRPAPGAHAGPLSIGATHRNGELGRSTKPPGPTEPSSSGWRWRSPGGASTPRGHGHSRLLGPGPEPLVSRSDAGGPGVSGRGCAPSGGRPRTAPRG